jgi:hypothetical protein
MEIDEVWTQYWARPRRGCANHQGDVRAWLFFVLNGPCPGTQTLVLSDVLFLELGVNPLPG